jgi:hypothetical protein
MDLNLSLTYFPSAYVSRRGHKRRAITLLAAAMFSAGQLSADCQVTNGQPTQGGPNNQATTAKKPAAPEDILIVQLKDGADRDEFNKLMEESHGKVINTIDAGKLKLLVIEAERGKAAELEKRFLKSKEVAIVRRNQMCAPNESVSPQGRGQVFGIHPQ